MRSPIGDLGSHVCGERLQPAGRFPPSPVIPRPSSFKGLRIEVPQKTVGYSDGLNGASSIVRHAAAAQVISSFTRAEYCMISAGATCLARLRN